MSIRFHEYRKAKPWVVTWRNPWTGKKHRQAFEDESHAQAFELAQAELAAREKALLKKARKQKQGSGRIRIMAGIPRTVRAGVAKSAGF